MPLIQKVQIPKLPLRFLFFTTSVITRNILQRRSVFTLQTWRRAALLLFNLRQHLRLIHILSHPQVTKLMTGNPELSYKYLRNYIALEISTANCLAILSEHYAYLQTRFKNDFLDIVYQSGIPLWAQCIDDVSFEIVMDFPHTIDFEGDLCLIFKKDQVSIYRIIFVIANGSSFGLPKRNVLFISSIQGMGDFEDIRLATKICCDIQPAQLLMAAMSGLGTALGFDTIVGIGNKNQLSKGAKLYFSYDHFFANYGNRIPKTNFYEIPLPYAEKPLDSIDARHRKRSQKKRVFKNEITDQVAFSIAQYCIESRQVLSEPLVLPQSLSLPL
ncbi:DUF535 domain-containing protein [Oxalobacteraceae bacterium CAVE-383]|nr:DUF535 domain-containing protein [Oxalobacteraceae bacterium CAVE-383]